MQCKLQNQNVLLNRKTLLTVVYSTLYNTLLNSDRLIGCLWSRDIE
jgi:hypothetical protein